MTDDILSGFARLVPITNQEQLDALKVEAASDNHIPLYPTHLVKRGDDVVGYISFLATPVVSPWLHSKKVRARDSLSLLNIIENMAAARGCRTILMPCAEHSPFYPVMEKLGFTRYGFTSFNVKKIGE